MIKIQFVDLITHIYLQVKSHSMHQRCKRPLTHPANEKAMNSTFTIPQMPHVDKIQKEVCHWHNSSL